MRKKETEQPLADSKQAISKTKLQSINTSEPEQTSPPEQISKQDHLLSWKSLSKTQQLLAVLCVLVLAMFMPEIAFIVDFAGIESAILFLLYYFKPQLNWIHCKLSQIRQELKIGNQLLGQSFAATGRGFSLTTTFSCGLVYLTSSMVMGGMIWMPALLILQQTPS